MRARIRRLGLRGRLVVVVTSVLAGGLMVSNVAAYLALRDHLVDRADGVLRAAQSRVLIALEGGPRQVDLALVDRIAPAQAFLVLLDDEGRVIASSTPIGGDQVPQSLSQAPLGTSDVDLSGDHPHRVLVFDLPVDSTLRVVREDGTAPEVVRRVAVGVPTDDAHATLAALLRTELVVSFVLMATATGLAVLGLRRALRPLRQMTDSASRIAQGHEDEVLPQPAAVGEIAELASVLNAAFGVRRSSEERIRQFVADASHELRSPLAVVHGWADLYHEGGVADPEALEEAMADIRAQSTRMRALVEDLLALARLGSAGAPDIVEELDLAELASEVLSEVSRLYPGHGSRPTGLSPLVVSGDPEATRRCVANLVRNAFEHTAPGCSVWIDGRVEGRTAVVEVHDDGAGLPDGAHEAAFERFWQAEPSRGPGGGTGLGLAIARGIARSGGGEVRLLARPGGGTIAMLTLPLAAEVGVPAG
ncbi:HAMP domain-containing sensor histidine kinase [Nocardioides sp.]|uniref:sensor histidine kinase n=1 Tax=Nocardioides sp. TaxID=35761 RepID=UPI001A2FF93A|nr:HAMP domain-containing sensor histidine kinase [Nocardioides sp.]MBJ7355924.1 HAMP domain-containing histidine kinase [Nocardioides sp.]